MFKVNNRRSLFNCLFLFFFVVVVVVVVVFVVVVVVVVAEFEHINSGWDA